MDKKGLVAELKKTLRKNFNYSPEQVDLGIEARFRCEYCGRDLLASVNDYDAWQTDHIVPTSKGGDPGTKNWALSCKTCNFIKGNWLPEDEDFGERTREEQIRMARDYIQERRVKKQLDIAKMRHLIWEFLSQPDA